MDQYELLDEGYQKTNNLNDIHGEFNQVGRFHEDIRLTLSQSITYIRDSRVVKKVLQRAKGHCEKCNSPAPFIRKSTGEPYLEVHHIVPLSEKGDDTIQNAMALCPNCHREVHYG